jgi:hypothetical protein
LVKVDVPVIYQHTSPYPVFDKCIETDGKAVFKVEKSFELRCANPGLKPAQILKLFN